MSRRCISIKCDRLFGKNNAELLSRDPTSYEIFSESDACVTPVLDMQEAQNHPHNVSRKAFINIDGFNQPNASPRYSKTKLEIKHNAKEVGVDLDDICNEFNISKEAF